MEILADILLLAGAIGAGVYCFVLSRRLRRFTNLEKGVGGAVAVLSMQVDDLTKTLEAAQISARDSVTKLADVNQRAEASARQLELMLASLHDLPSVAAAPAARPQTPTFQRDLHEALA